MKSEKKVNFSLGVFLLLFILIFFKHNFLVLAEEEATKLELIKQDKISIESNINESIDDVEQNEVNNEDNKYENINEVEQNEINSEDNKCENINDVEQNEVNSEDNKYENINDVEQNEINNEDNKHENINDVEQNEINNEDKKYPRPPLEDPIDQEYINKFIEDRKAKYIIKYVYYDENNKEREILTREGVDQAGSILSIPAINDFKNFELADDQDSRLYIKLRKSASGYKNEVKFRYNKFKNLPAEDLLADEDLDRYKKHSSYKVKFESITVEKASVEKLVYKENISVGGYLFDQVVPGIRVFKSGEALGYEQMVLNQENIYIDTLYKESSGELTFLLTKPIQSYIRTNHQIRALFLKNNELELDLGIVNYIEGFRDGMLPASINISSAEELDIDNPYIYPHININSNEAPTFNYKIGYNDGKFDQELSYYLEIGPKQKINEEYIYYDLIGPYYDGVHYKINFKDKSSGKKLKPSVKELIYMDKEKLEESQDDLKKLINNREDLDIKGWNLLNLELIPVDNSNDLIEVNVYYSDGDSNETGAGGGGGGGSRPSKKNYENIVNIYYIDLENNSYIKDSEKREIESIDNFPIPELDGWVYIKMEIEEISNNKFDLKLYYSKRRIHQRYIYGYEDGMLRPEGNITKEEAATIIARQLDSIDIEKKYNLNDFVNFKDLDPKSWSYNDIKILTELNVIHGYKDGTFKPKNHITRGEIASLIANFKGIKPDYNNIVFTDIDNHWARGYINSLYKEGIVLGYGVDLEYKPEDKLTRAEFVSIINKMTHRKPYNLIEGGSNYLDLNKNSWYYNIMYEATNSHYYYRVEDREYWISLIK